ncbi:MAG: helix-turn-helix transcriptional regulator [Candidatus Cloacimonetes bacterium]|nr:helix-turn-helix transcriptional regulator [Candidatus Cloacimonadota bacterium]
MKLSDEKMMIFLAEKGMMIKDLCAEAGISETAFKKIREGKRIPRTTTIGRIAKALHVSVADIIE